MSYTNGLDKPSDYFSTKLYSGDGSSSHAVSGIGFQPDWVWIKQRDIAENHMIYDSVRGATKDIRSDGTYAENTNAQSLQSFNSDGFTLGNLDNVNKSSGTFASWNWKAGGSASSNSDGSITSTVSADTTSGFSIVSYTGNGSAGATVGHGLGNVVPKMIIIKGRGTTYNWVVGHNSLSTNWGKYLTLSTTDAVETATNIFNDTAPTSSLFSLGTALGVNTSSSTYIAYCFSEKKGFSKMGSYVGIASSDSNFVFLGFKPSFLLIKNISSGSTNWHMYDNKRLGYNVDNNMLRANLNNASQTDDDIDLLSNGFKLRRSTSALNNSGDTFIYYAVAESPFVTGASAIPTTAR